GESRARLKRGAESQGRAPAAIRPFGGAGGERTAIGRSCTQEGMNDATEYLRFFVTLIAVVDPFLAVPIFLAVTSGRRDESRARLARAIALTVFVVLSITAFVGEALLTIIGASLPSFRVGGGLVLLLMALAMLNAEAGPVRHTEAEAQEAIAGDVGGIVPLAIPLLAGPGAIS